MFIKKEEVNDLNDISLVNPELEHKNGLETISNILKTSAFNFIYLLLPIYLDVLFMVALIDTRQYELLINYEVIIVINHSFSLTFLPGLLNLLYNKSDFSNLYYEAISLSILCITFIFCPLLILLVSIKMIKGLLLTTIIINH